MDFEYLCEFFLEICVKIRIFVQNTWKSKTIFYQQKPGNPTSSIGGGQNFSGTAHFQLCVCETQIGSLGIDDNNDGLNYKDNYLR